MTGDPAPVHLPGRVDFPALYRELIDRYGDDPRAAAWHSDESQHARFAIVAQYVGADDSLLDVGCGPAHLAAYLRSGGWRGDYLGVDPLPEMVRLATRRGERAVVGRAGAPRAPLARALAEGGLGSFDVVVANGVAGEQPGDERCRLAWLRRFLAEADGLARQAVVMTFLSADLPAGARLPGRWFARLGKVAEVATGLGHPVTVRHDYRRDDFTLVVHAGAGTRNGGGSPSPPPPESPA